MTIRTHYKQTEAFTLMELILVVVVIAVLVGMIFPMHYGGKARSTRIKCVSQLKQIGLAYKVFAGDNDDLMPWQVRTNIAFQDETRTWIHFQAMSNELSTTKILLCPDDKSRVEKSADNFKIGVARDAKSLSVLGNEAVSYFVGIEANETRPQAILSGDRNVASKSELPAYSTRIARGTVTPSPTAEWSLFEANRIHENQGNILLGDGSVAQASVSILVNQMTLASGTYKTNVNRFVFPQ
jgi:prepilin-type processing-associated H-X9-DG protein